MENDDIAVQPLLLDIGSSIYAIYMQSLYYLAPDIINSLHNINKFLDKYNVTRFDFIEYENEEEFMNGKYEYHVVPWGSMMRCIEELKKHPSINILNKT